MAFTAVTNAYGPSPQPTGMQGSLLQFYDRNRKFSGLVQSLRLLSPLSLSNHCFIPFKLNVKDGLNN